ncbi:hypothetical protein [Brucella sp. IR073]|uniref:hypothetical protein n=1 Tax=unclassified Brucella TaxID=2632610 RepID=UPI003B97EDA9
MARRTLVALTDAQIGVLNRVFKTFEEDGDGLPEHDPAIRHIENIKRQIRREYTPSERTAIFEEAVRISKEAHNAGK